MKLNSYNLIGNIHNKLDYQIIYDVIESLFLVLCKCILVLSVLCFIFSKFQIPSLMPQCHRGMCAMSKYKLTVN